MMLSATLSISPMSTNASTMQSLAFSHRRVVPSGNRLSPAILTGVSMGGSLSLPSLTMRCSSVSTSASTSFSVDERRKFLEATKYGNLIPLYQCIFSDQLTPVLAYRSLVKEDDREAPSFLFESAEPNFQSSNVGRYSVVGSQPTMEIVAKENKVTIMDHELGHLTEEIVDDPLVIPGRISQGWRPYLTDELPDAFCAWMLTCDA